MQCVIYLCASAISYHFVVQKSNLMKVQNKKKKKMKFAKREIDDVLPPSQI